MMAGLAPQASEIISFGPFNLFVNERLLTRDGFTLQLSARAFDILFVLVSRPNQAIGKKELMDQVWPDVTVSEGSLRFHVAALRKALGDGKNGARYITTLAGRGYSFVAQVLRSGGQAKEQLPATANFPNANLPSRLLRMVGRSDTILIVTSQLLIARFVSIVSAGGVGKTTVAVAVGHELLEEFTGAVVFVDLGALSDPNLVVTSLAAMLGLTIQSQDAMPSLIAYLRDKRILLILDTCEHLIEAVAALAAQIFRDAPQIYILATSREALRVEGEHVYKLDPLACPPDDLTLTAGNALKFAAVQLFAERAAASGDRLDLTDADATIVAAICRKLDGVALAIELAAGRVGTYGLEQTATLLENRLNLLWQGQRGAPHRQKTLQATLDWSYGLLSETERLVLRHLAIFVAYFTIDGALAVVTSPFIDQEVVFGAIDSLVAKSMVATRSIGAMIRYRLLDTTRAYALEINLEDAERTALAERHATYYWRWLEQVGADWTTLSNAEERAPYLAGLHNVRSALEWSFGDKGNAKLGVGLASAAAHVFLAMSLPTECHRWSERAIQRLDHASQGGQSEMLLQTALGMSVMFTRGMGDAARTAFNRGLAIADERGDAFNQLQVLGPLYMFHFRTGDYQTALKLAERTISIAKTIEDPAGAALAHSLLGITHHKMGELANARFQLEAALQRGKGSLGISAIHLGFDQYKWANAALARILWMQGHPVQASARARENVEAAASVGHPVTLSIVLNWAISVFFWNGDLESAEAYADWFISLAESHSLGPYLALGRGHKGELAIRRGDPKAGVEIVRGCLNDLHLARYELSTTAFTNVLVQGLAALGEFTEGISLIDYAIRQVEENKDFTYLPDLLRVKGRLLRSMPRARIDEAEMCFVRSLELSRHQGALAWELRAAIDLAALRAAQGQADNARAILLPIFEQFTEGFDTEDLKTAAHLLASLN